MPVHGSQRTKSSIFGKKGNSFTYSSQKASDQNIRSQSELDSTPVKLGEAALLGIDRYYTSESLKDSNKSKHASVLISSPTASKRDSLLSISNNDLSSFSASGSASPGSKIVSNKSRPLSALSSTSIFSTTSSDSNSSTRTVINKVVRVFSVISVSSVSSKDTIEAKRSSFNPRFSHASMDFNTPSKRISNNSSTDLQNQRKSAVFNKSNDNSLISSPDVNTPSVNLNTSMDLDTSDFMDEESSNRSNLRRSTLNSNLTSFLSDEFALDFSLELPGNGNNLGLKSESGTCDVSIKPIITTVSNTSDDSSFTSQSSLDGNSQDTSELDVIPVITTTSDDFDSSFMSHSSLSSSSYETGYSDYVPDSSHSSGNNGEAQSQKTNYIPTLRTVSSLLSLKKGGELKHKKIDKDLISLPTSSLNPEDHFSPYNAASTSAPSSQGSNNNRHSVFSSISSMRSFKSFSKNDDMSVSPTLNSSNASIHSMNSKSASKKASFSDVRKSIMSMSPSTSSLFRSRVSTSPSVASLSSKRSIRGLNGSFLASNNNNMPSSFDKTTISLPTPMDSSRDKLRNKLRGSPSLLSLYKSTNVTSDAVALPIVEYERRQLENLLGLCTGSDIDPFNTFIGTLIDEQNETLLKLNEASYSEVFVTESIQDRERNRSSKVYKIIPFGNRDLRQSKVEDIIQELSIAKLAMNIEGFVPVYDAHVVQGHYPQYLLDLWDQYAKVNSTYNRRPDYFGEDQLYCVLVLADAGIDLEHFKIASWSEANTIFWKTVKSLSEAEKCFEFEHRDLHWGNLVISRGHSNYIFNDNDSKTFSTDSCSETESNHEISYDYDVSGVCDIKVTLIDYTLSRAKNPLAVDSNNIFFTGLDQPEFFRGHGDYQFDIYRLMRKLINNTSNRTTSASSMTSTSSSSSSAVDKNNNLEVDWSIYVPKTNILWLHYLVDKLINHKGLENIAPVKSGKLSFGGSNASIRSSFLSGSETSSNSDYSDRVHSDANACKLLTTIHNCIDPKRKRLGAKRSGLKVSFYDFNSCDDVWNWGRKNGLMPEGI
ncbi:hypothetical protein NADFUDRAFT_50936 [Nadsonia fulvescens var. elongata DSM 6958]|uniref:non-specific serine/threonine protein kinase n=1 Tax=Nadsonia fulvescens var. elongata DSM 6958 TaxID=857566 RepID=A0A1E3PL23_9ASCO|nr:hypothetical protein NADFUDRAFT_50936 [Nadsonia fulvescens var. elongata DSM 6958]